MSAIELDSDEEIFSQLIIKSQSLTASSTQATEGSNENSSNANASSSKAALTNPYKLLDDNPSQYSLNIQTPWTNAEVKHLKTVMSSRNYGRKCKSWKDFSNNDWNSWAKRVLPKRTGTDMMNMWLVLRRNKVSKLNEDSVVSVSKIKGLKPYVKSNKRKKDSDNFQTAEWSTVEINLLKKIVAEYDAGHPTVGDTEILRDWNLISLAGIGKKSDEACRTKWRQLETLANGKKLTRGPAKVRSPRKSPLKKSGDPLRILPQSDPLPLPLPTPPAIKIPIISLKRKPAALHKEELEAIDRLINYPDSYNLTVEIGVLRVVKKVSWKEASAALNRIIEMNWD